MSIPVTDQAAIAFQKLGLAVRTTLETYSNVHRGSGHYSRITTGLYEKARSIVADYLKINPARYVVIFGSSRSTAKLIQQLHPGDYLTLNSQEFGLPLGVTAVAVRRNKLPAGTPALTGGGNARLISRDWVIWSRGAGRFEAGTPAIVNVIAFARALQLIRVGHSFLQNTDSASENTDPRNIIDSILYKDPFAGLLGRPLLERLRETLIGRDRLVPTAGGDRSFINFDNAASTQTFEPIWDAVTRSSMLPAESRQSIIHEVKRVCGSYLGAPSDDFDIIFTANTTEAINLVAESFHVNQNHETSTLVVNTLLEHSSNELPWRFTSPGGLIRLSVNTEGFIDIEELRSILKAYNLEKLHGNKRIGIVAVSGASNVLGTYNNLQSISRVVHGYGARLLVDAAQLAAHRQVNMKETGIDFLALSAHKMYAPFGSGVLAVRKGLLDFPPEEMEQIRISGEQNSWGIAALGKALILLSRIGHEVIREEEQKLTARALAGLSKIPGLSIYGIKDPDSPVFASKGGVIPMNLERSIAPRISGELAMRAGIGIRSGCHCAHLLVKHTLTVTPGLEKFQRIIVTLFPGLSLPGLARVSFGLANTAGEVDTLVKTMGEIAGKTRFPESSVKKEIKTFVEASIEGIFSNIK